MKPLLTVLALMLSSGGAKPQPASLSQLSFLVGTWETTLGRAQVEELWMPPAGGTMLGLSRTIVGDRTASFEFLRIEARADGIYYVAQPNGRAPTEFKLTRLEGQTAVFENPQHDHPKLIRYRGNPDGSLLAQVEGEEKGKRVVQDFPYRRTKN
ncbi:MAG: DUF6265 family protein [Myxococcaceae bacterium]|nr:DUF6265 family protein [Myxococcaceae bacterium]